MNLALKAISRSLFFVCFISGLAGLAGWFLGISFWGVFTGIAFLQFVIGGFINTTLERKDSMKIAEIDAMIELASAEKNIDIGCAYCNVPNTVPFMFGQVNSFECKSCKSRNAVSIQFMATRTTIPVVSHGDVSVAVSPEENEQFNNVPDTPTIIGQTKGAAPNHSDRG